MSGWAKLGEALAGTSPARRADIEAKTMTALAARDAKIAAAKMAMGKARDQAALGDYFKEIGMENPDAYAGVARSGVNLNTLTRGQGNMQEQAFREAAVEAATKGDWAAGNANMLGVASGPVEIPKVTNGVMLSNRLIPGGGNMTVTPVGEAQIGADNARGQAALIRANRAPASRSGGGSGGGSAKLTDRQKGQLADIKERKKIVMGVIEATAGAANPASVAERTKAERALQELNAAESAIYDQQEGLGSRIAPAEPSEVNGVAIPNGFTPEQFQHAIAINLDRRKSGLPDLTEAQMQQLRKTGEVRESVKPRVQPPAGAIQMLRSNPKLAAQFEEKYGVPAATYLGN